ncbi:Ankyrin-1 [Colletotrichum orbiculare MAFF 240422]|uniref:Ankyrin-1 n=1 Tax=Colletotrichum orbiculare (strain 104-T / ATCC 96160 / CBS 514.97 / LARS 414 / MAFF 240422) TaxID=1213857 RepID=A0A484FG91_COLOR|nr:Ankyrin-1 [Colletotrichum orbiculare MAFF 240422]
MTTSSPNDDSRCVDAFKSDVDHVAQKDRNYVCAPDTGNWFFHHPEYESFQTAREPRMLLVTAEAGGGKSTAMRTLVDNLQASSKSPLVAYFFFKDDHDRLRSYQEALSSLIHQLLLQDRELSQCAREVYRKHGDAVRQRIAEMWQVLLNIAMESKRDVFCILDAVDECAAPGIQQLLVDLANVFQKLAQPTTRLKVVLSSRPYEDINVFHEKLFSHDYFRHLAGEDARVQSDIRAVIRFKTQQLAQQKGLSQTIQDVLIQRMSEQNVRTRSFLAVQVAFDLLSSHAEVRKGVTEQTISNILAEIPQHLGDQFEEMLARSLDKEHAWKLFCVILVARRTIKIHEFKVIYALTQSRSTTVDRPRSYDDLGPPIDDEEFKRSVRSRCGLFVTFVGSSVHLFHQTAREYLMAKPEIPARISRARPWQKELRMLRDSAWKGSISQAEANLVCANVCLDILTLDVSRTWVLEVLDTLNAGNGMYDDVEDFVKKRPFLPYAAYNWHEHVVLGADGALELLREKRYRAKYIQDRESQDDIPHWEAEDGYELIDAFHVAFGEHHLTSINQAVTAMEKGDNDRGSMLSKHVPQSTLIWTCITEGTPSALRNVLASVTSLEWLDDLPEQIMYPRKKWHGWSSRTGEALRKDRQKGWTKPWPPSFATIARAGVTKEELFEVIAEWVESFPTTADHAQRVWEAGGFFIPSLSRSLVQAGASIHTEMWKEGKTALQIAATFWEHDLIATLLDLGADPLHCSDNGYTVLHWMFHREESLDTDQNSAPMLNSQRKKAYTGNPRYRRSKISGSVKALCRRISSQESALDTPSSKGKTPLMLAVKCSATATETLLSEGADPDKGDDRGRTPLMHFFRGQLAGRSITILQLLLKSRADVRAADSSGKTVLGYWANRITNNSLSNLYPGSNFYNKAFNELASLGALSERNVLVKELTSLDVPLVVAARLGNARLCWALLDTGANPDKHGITADSPLGWNSGSVSSNLEDLAWNPVMVALQAKAYVTTAILLAYGANLTFELPKRRRARFNKFRIRISGLTPLHLAVGGNERHGWSSTEIGLSSGGYSKGCSFAAVANPDYPVSKMSPMEMLAKRQNEDHARYRAEEFKSESSDSEFEMQRFAFANDSTGAEKVPFDSLFGGLKFTSKTPCHSLLESVISNLQASTDRQETLVLYMLRNGASVNARTVENITPLIASVEAGNLKIVKVLLDHGADPNISGAGGGTPLMIAANNGRRDLVEVLLASGANPNAQTDQVTPDRCACASFVKKSSFIFDRCHAPLTALVVATERGHVDVVETLLANGADVNLRIVHHAHGRLPFKKKHSRLYPPSSSDSESEPEPERWEGHISVGTALTWARDEIRDVLLRHGADPGVEEPTRRCGCQVIERRTLNTNSDDEYPQHEESDSGVEFPWRQRRHKVKRQMVDKSSSDES